MLGDQTTPPRPGWRPAGGSGERTARTGPRWRRGPAAHAPRRSRWTRRAQLAVAVPAFAAACALLIWVSSWLRPPRPARLVLIGAGYEGNLAIPHNAYGREGLRRLARLAVPADPAPRWGSGRPVLKDGPRVLRVGEAWDEGIGPIRERALIVVLALHGGADDRGAYLLPDDAEIADDPRNRLRLAEVLDGLARLPARKPKLLILDATQVAAHWPLGMLHNDFARELAGLDGRIAEIPNLAVLSACDVDQRSCAADALRQTVFSHYLVDGLAGAAAGEGGRIDAERLYRYTLGNVRRWVAANSRERQTPVLFPSGELGLRRARAIDLAVIDRHTMATPQDHSPAPPDPAPILAAWERFGRLRGEVPAPGVHAPHLWRHYQELLLRRQQLAMAGAAEAADALAPRLDQLEREIRSSRYLTLASAANTLAMPAAEGRTPPAPGPGPLQGTFDDLWNAPAREHVGRWAKLRAASPDPSALRLGLADLLLGRAAEDPARNLEPAYQLAGLLDDPARPRPAEVHDLIMLHWDRPPDPLPPEYYDQVATALGLRRLAERTALAGGNGPAYPYAEEVAPWTRAALDEADGHRRLGQDLLLAADPPSWAQAGTHFRAAERAYLAAQAGADEVRGAFAARDAVLSALPYYSDWIARSLPAGGPAREPRDRLVAAARALWDATHALMADLDADPGAAPRPPLAERTDAVRRGFADLEAQFTRAASGIEGVELPGLWHATAAALGVPFADVPLRARLMANLRRIELQFLTEMHDPARLADDPAADLPPALAAADARDQGLMALGVLGRRRFDVPGGAGQGAGRAAEGFAQVLARLRDLDVDPHWWEAADRAGAQIGDRWRRLGPEIARLADAARGADPDRARAALRDADRLARQLDGATALATTARPAPAYRRWLVQDLLLAQVRRSFGDHWFAEDPDAEPYYRAAGLLYLDDVRQLDDPGRPARQAAAADWVRRLEGPGGLEVAGPGRLVATSERQFALQYRLETPSADIPAGFPVVWIEPGKDLRAVAPTPAGRLVRRLGNPPDPPIVCTLESPLLLRAEAEPPRVPRVTRTALTLRGRYRGQVLGKATAVELHPLPDVVAAERPPPATAGLAVRAELGLFDRLGDSNGAIAIVLDCSGSMGAPSGQPWGPGVKFQEATDSLRRLLRKVARGTRVSVWVFGEALGRGETVADAERTILPIRPPVTWDPDDPALLRDLMARLAYPALVPWNESPIVRAMLRARDDLRNVPGFKSLIVLTDGMDNRFARDAEWNPGGKKSIPTALREAFGRSDIEINVIGYRVADPAEEEAARQQFKVIEELPRPGKFYSVKQAADLNAVLEGALRKRLRCWVEGEDNILVLGMAADGLDVSPPGADDRWLPAGLAPGGYQVVVEARDRPRKDVAFDRGDLLLVKLAETARGVAFRRVDYSREDHAGKPAAEAGDWRLAVLQNQRIGAGLQMLATLEKAFDPRETRLQVLRPWETWIEVQPWPTAQTPFALRWGNQPGYPAAAWGLDVPEWPASPGTATPARPAVRAWWDPDRRTPPAGSLDRGPDFDLDATGGTPPLRIDGDEVRLLGVGVEDHPVETAPGRRESKPCLVIRVAYAPGKPVWVRPKGLNPAGHEHRFYAEARRYTGLFWPVTRDEARDSLAGLEFVSLTDFKARAERRGFALELRTLGPPEPNDVRPRAVGMPATLPTLPPSPFAPLWRASAAARVGR